MMQASIVVPTYNRPDRLHDAVESIRSQVGHVDFEVVLVDDGSESQHQQEMLDELDNQFQNLRCIRQRNAGPAAARNQGWREADSDIILFTDDDCIVPQNWVSSLIDAFEQGVAAVGGPFVPAETHYNNSSFAKYHRAQAEDMYRPIEQGRKQDQPLPHGITANIAYRRSVLEEVNGFDESFPVAGGEDADLIRRVADRGYSFKYVPTPVHHNDPYTLRTFLKREYNRGKGVHYLHERHGPKRNLQRVIYGLCAAPFFLPKEIVEQRSLKMAGIAVLSLMIARLGEISAIHSN